MLSDVDKRKNYDSGGFAGVSGFSAEDLFGGINVEDIFGGFGSGFGGDDLFGSFFPGGRRKKINRGNDITVQITVPLVKILYGSEEKVSIPHSVVCNKCNGSGCAEGTRPRVCSKCHGTGQITNSRRQGNIAIQEITTCTDCRGKGSFIDKPCAECHGTGQVHRGDTLSVKIPAGAEEDMVLRIPGHGMPPPVAGGQPGDLLVVVRTEPDIRFKRSGTDLWHTQVIGLTDAVLGTEIDVPTLEKAVKVRVPAGTQSGSILRLRNKGLPVFEREERGDILLQLIVHIPENLTSEERQLYEKIRKIESAKGKPFSRFF